MIKISEAQFNGLNAAAEDQFAQQLVAHLSERKPELLPSFDEQVRPKIVRCMIERARMWGVSWEASLALFTDLMQIVAPNFARYPDIHQQLTAGRQSVNETILKINQLVSPDVWKRAESERVSLYMYHSPKLDRAPLSKRIEAAVPLVLWDKVEELTVPVIVDLGFEKSKILGFSGFDDGPLVAALAASLYGKDFIDPRLNEWVKDLLVESRIPVRLEKLRSQISTDFDRRV